VGRREEVDIGIGRRGRIGSQTNNQTAQDPIPPLSTSCLVHEKACRIFIQLFECVPARPSIPSFNNNPIKTIINRIINTSVTPPISSS